MSARSETQRQRRGHDFWPPADLAAQVPAVYGTVDTDSRDKILWLHYFVGGCDWWVAELDPHTCEAFGYVCLGDPLNAEWGYVDLAELETISVRGLWVVERDLHWTPAPAREVELPGWRWY